MNILFYLFSALLFFCSCGQNIKNKETEQTIHLKAVPEEKTAPLSQLLEIKRYIPLETPAHKGGALGNISKLIVTEDAFIIFDEFSMSVFIFARSSGQLRGLITAQGNGPGEYAAIIDIAYRAQTQEIVILAPRKILCFTVEGRFKKEQPFQIIASYINSTPEGHIVVSPDYAQTFSEDNQPLKNNILLLDSNWNVVKGYMPFKKAMNPMSDINSFQNNGKELLYVDKYGNNLYSFSSKDSLRLRYHIDYGNDNDVIAEKIVAELQKERTMTPTGAFALEQKYGYCSLLNVIDNETFLFLLYRRGAEWYHYAFYDKQTRVVDAYALRHTGDKPPVPLYNDWDAAPYYIFVGGYGDMLIGYTTPDYLMSAAKQSNQALETIRPALQKNGNFVLVEFTRKKS